MRRLRIAVAIGLLPVIAAAAFVWHSQPKLIDGIDPPPRSAFHPAEIERGARLAAIGNCHLCHTAPGGADYAGNRPIPTRFGVIYSTNITPAPGSGIGHWSLAAFTRAMRDGISRRGRHLYPAFPYPHFARLGDDDIEALYAFVMTRRPVETYQQTNRLRFPFGQRWLMSFWNLLFLDTSPYRPDARQTAQWNRGAYLVAGLGHCGDCHTPRNLLGAEQRRYALAGGEGMGWLAPALDAGSPAPLPWDAAHSLRYLRDSWDPDHGAAAGPMQAVSDDLAQADEADLRAIAAYLATRQGKPSAARRERATKALAQAAEPALPAPRPGEELGAAIFAGACARCHVGRSAMVAPRGIDLALSSVVNQRDPRDAILVLLDGIRPTGERAGPWMPGFAGALSDPQLAALLAYIRAHYGSGSPWSGLAAQVSEVRPGGGKP